MPKGVTTRQLYENDWYILLEMKDGILIRTLTHKNPNAISNNTPHQ